jgi:pimeloyl-ACP methyl ester carboxylesterase
VKKLASFTLFLLAVMSIATCGVRPAPAPTVTSTAVPIVEPTDELAEVLPRASSALESTDEPQSAAAPTEVPAATGLLLEERQCDLFIPAGDAAGESIVCGYVVVPAERNNPESKEVKLAYVILKSTGDNPSPDPITHVSGGPGIAATSRTTIVEFVNRYAPMREMRDIILYDQRGIGNSLPVMNCVDFVEGDSGDDASGAADIYSRCPERMRSQGYPPEIFSTAVSAADLVDLMHALDYPAYNLYGISYGSRLLMSMMHYSPDEPLVRSIVLDSVDTLPEDTGTEYIAATHLLQQELFESVFDECAADPACAKAYPDLRTRFSTLVEQLNQDPLTLDEYTAVDGDLVHRHFFPYNPAVQNIPYQPQLVAELEQGITTTLELIRSGGIPEPATRTSALPPEPPIAQDLLDLYLDCEDSLSDDGDAIAARLTGLWDAEPEEVADYLTEACGAETAAAAIQITDENPRIFNYVILRFVPDAIPGLNPDLNSKFNCTEQFPFREDFAEIEENLRKARMPDFFIEETIDTMKAQADGCQVWQDALTAPTPDSYGDYPTLILNGQFDSLTPPAWAETAVAAIPQAQHVQIPNAWHSIMGNNGPCPTDITLQFLANPDAAVDASCTDGMKVSFFMAVAK